MNDETLPIDRRAAAFTTTEVEPSAQGLLASIVESSDDAIISKNLDSIITSWNAAATRLFGYTAEEIIGKPITTLIPPDRLDEEVRIIEGIRQGRRVDHYETIRRCKDGRMVEISLSISPVFDVRGQIIGASKIARDITEQKKAERALLDADRKKNEFIATLAHELRNQLAPVRNSLNVLRLARGDAPAAEVLHGIMERQVNHMVRLVDDLMDISRITAGKIELRRERVEVAAFVRSAVETSRPLITARHHQLVTRMPTEPLTIEGDEVRLSQAVANLLNNASKYTDPGGTIWLTVAREGDSVLISVRDTGIGIPSELLPHILEMFMQADSARRHSQDGLGIGLALVKRMVELHGGTITARSPGEGKGSEFIVRLPLAEHQLMLPLSKSPEGEPRPVGSQRILVVDDNADSASSLAMVLKILGSDARVAHDGRSALEMFESYRPSVVLLDLAMPDMSGYEVASHLRASPHFQNVTLVALTGWGQEEDRRKTHEAGFNYHLTKPVELDALQDLLSGAASHP